MDTISPPDASLRAWGQRGSVNVAKCSCNDEGTSIPMPSSPVVQKASGGKRFDHFNGKPSQFPNALTLGKGGGEGVARGGKGKGILIHSLTEGNGMPLANRTTPANGDERAQVVPLLDAVK